MATCLASAKALSDSDYSIRAIDNFDVYLYSSSILFGLDSTEYNYVALEPLNATAINGTNCQLWAAGMYGGKFYFLAQENATAEIHESLGGVRLNGQIVGEGSIVPIVSGNGYTLEWSYTMTPLISLALILAIIGFACTFGGPFYTLSKWRDGHDIDGMIAGTVITLIGIALLLGWLFV